MPVSKKINDISPRASKKIRTNPKAYSENTLQLENSMKKEAYRDYLSIIRQDLSKKDRLFSVYIHFFPIEKAHTSWVRFLFRANHFLLASIFSLAGTLLTYYYARHYGFTYNSLFLFVFFVSGYILSILINIVAFRFKEKERT
jgi:hypothetical protein